jgi:hypothetical protein
VHDEIRKINKESQHKQTEANLIEEKLVVKRKQIVQLDKQSNKA